MKTVIIKPHHFMDIFKLYGTGIEEFVPDQKMEHDFYAIANAIIKNPYLVCQLTIEGDDICKPCHYYQKHQCQDTLFHIQGISKKGQYNQLLDQRIIELYQLYNTQYQVLELCQIFYRHHELIAKVWKEEDDQQVEKRRDFFVKGVEKYFFKYKDDVMTKYFEDI
ncbi:hypothetical protein [Massilimicrobiota sp. An80]|uniref:hypothetical protein n=1 Tax=Massilimicrobiota sp. An80 TaxID=1965658 RepID=UPI00194F21F8|nr:hypothetical protein [Massilimicrobiota sp. An80]